MSSPDGRDRPARAAGPGGAVYPTTERSGGRLQKVVVYTVSVAVAVAAAVLVYQRFGVTDEVSGEETGFELVDDSTVSVRFDVTRRDPSIPVFCIVRARSLDGSETGRREVYVPPSTDTLSSYDAVVHTSKPPVVGDVYGCGTDVPEYLLPQ